MTGKAVGSKVSVTPSQIDKGISAKAPTTPSAVDKTKATTYELWAQEWNKTRLEIKKYLQVPSIVQFSGTAHSDPNTMGYSKLTLSWKAEHPVGISEYSFAVPYYGEAATASQGLPTGYGTWGVSGSVQGPPGPWCSVASKQDMVIPFFLKVHQPGTYNIGIRARGAGGYTLERWGTVNVAYAFGADQPGGPEFGPPTKTSTLNVTDNTPPFTPIVTVNSGDETSNSTTSLYAEWSSQDYESGIQEYQYQVGYYKKLYKVGTEPFEGITPTLSAGGQTKMNIRLDTPMEPGVIYKVRVKAKNGVGMWSEGVSNGIQLSDPTPPTKPVIVSVSLMNTLAATWISAEDPESGVNVYQIALGTSAGAADLIEWANVQGTPGEKQVSLLVEAAELTKMLTTRPQKQKTYYFSVRAKNGIGLLGAADTKAVKLK
jgi:hypothetical protein